MNADQTGGIWLLLFVIVGLGLEGSPSIASSKLEYYLSWLGFYVGLIGGSYLLFKGTNWEDFTPKKWIEKYEMSQM